MDEIKLLKQYTDGAPSEGVLSNKKHCSLGDFYQSATIFAGFDGGDEGKTMGLAPFGTDKYFKEFSSAIQFDGESWSIDPEFQFNKWQIKTEETYSFKIIHKGSEFLIKELPNSKDHYEDSEEIIEKI